MSGQIVAEMWQFPGKNVVVLWWKVYTIYAGMNNIL